MTSKSRKQPRFSNTMGNGCEVKWTTSKEGCITEQKGDENRMSTETSWVHAVVGGQIEMADTQCVAKFAQLLMLHDQSNLPFQNHAELWNVVTPILVAH